MRDKSEKKFFLEVEVKQSCDGTTFFVYYTVSRLKPLQTTVMAWLLLPVCLVPISISPFSV